MIDAVSLTRETYGETWHISEADVDRVLWQQSQNDLPSVNANEDTIREWERLRKKEIDLDLHGLFLSDYFRAKKIPRGFRIRNVPTIGRSNPDFCKKWIGVLNRCSFDLMILVIEEVAGDLTRIRKTLAAQELEQARLFHSEIPDPILTRAQTQIDKYKQGLLQFKREKFRRVNEDYANFRVYRWLTGERDSFPAQRMRRFPRRKLNKPLNSVDTSSGDSEADDTQSTNTLPTEPHRSEVPSGVKSPPPFLEVVTNDRPPSGRGTAKDIPHGGVRRGRPRKN